MSLSGLSGLSGLSAIIKVGGLSPAGSITIPNFSFESPAQSAGASASSITSWTIGSGTCGVTNLTGQSKITPDSINGSQVAFISGSGGLISITLSDVFENRQYRFDYSAGRRNDINYPSVIANGAGVVLVGSSGVSGFDYLPIPASGAWVTKSITFTPDPSDVGSPIDILFQAGGFSGTSRALLDNLTLTKL